MNRFPIVAVALVLGACSSAPQRPVRETSAVERQRAHELAELPDAGGPQCDCNVVCECTDVPIDAEERKLADAIAADCRRKDIVCECPICASR